MGLAVYKSGKVIVVLRGAMIAELADHIRNGYPQYVPDLPVLTAEEYPDEALPPVAPPDPPTLEELAAAEAEALQIALLRGIVKVLFNQENRIRALEAKPSITENQFKAALKTILSL